jgi:peptidoglycan/LPS O-acetylase OafA/YrhL
LPSFLSLRRITASGTYLPEIDGLRFVAIFVVMVFHIARLAQMHMGYFPWPQNRVGAFAFSMVMNGAYGVPLFFAISGFILGLPFAKQYLIAGKKVGLKAYLLRRVTRLEPPYIASLLIRTGPVMAAKHMTFLMILPHLVASLFYVHLIVYHELPLVQLVAWSLEIEIQFYLLIFFVAPLLFLANAVIRRILFVVLLIAPGIAQHYLFHDSFVLHNCILNWFQFFLAGMFVADLFLTDFKRIPSSWLWDVLSAVLWATFFSVPEYGSQVFGPSMLVLLFIGAFKGKAFRWFYSAAPIAIIGGMCYSIYLTHSLVLQGAAWVFYKFASHGAVYPRYVLSVVLIVPVLIAVGAIFFVLLERPCMDKRWPQKLMAFLRGKSNQPSQPLTEGGA